MTGVGFLDTIRTAARLPELLAASSATLPPVHLASPWAPYPNHLHPIVVGDVFDLAHQTMTRDAAMRVPTVARARRLICN